jgi:hypothetical protein
MKTLEELRPLIFAAHNEYIRAARIWWDARRDKAPSVDIRIAHWKMAVAAEKNNALAADARDTFARSRGWRVDTRCRVYPATTYGALSRRVIDHPDFFRAGAGRMVGFITHTAAKVDEIMAYAEQYGYSAEVLPYSWYEPDYYTAVLLTPKADGDLTGGAA